MGDNRKQDAIQLKFLDKLLERPENQNCADCKTTKPRWASVNIGCFLCIRCAGIHRKLGTHISKIKSSNLDIWKPEWMEFVSSMGNEKVNAKYLATESPRPNLTSDSDMEEYVRNKYEKQLYSLSPTGPGSASNYSRQLESLGTMGFGNQALCLKALEQSKGSIERAVEILTSSKDSTPRHHSSQSQQLEATATPVIAAYQISLKNMGFSNTEANEKAYTLSHGKMEDAVSLLIEWQTSKSQSKVEPRLQQQHFQPQFQAYPQQQQFQVAPQAQQFQASPQTFQATPQNFLQNQAAFQNTSNQPQVANLLDMFGPSVPIQSSQNQFETKRSVEVKQFNQQQQNNPFTSQFASPLSAQQQNNYRAQPEFQPQGNPQSMLYSQQPQTNPFQFGGAYDAAPMMNSSANQQHHAQNQKNQADIQFQQASLLQQPMQYQSFAAPIPFQESNQTSQIISSHNPFQIQQTYSIFDQQMQDPQEELMRQQKADFEEKQLKQQQKDSILSMYRSNTQLAPGMSQFQNGMQTQVNPYSTQGQNYFSGANQSNSNQQQQQYAPRIAQDLPSNFMMNQSTASTQSYSHQSQPLQSQQPLQQFQPLQKSSQSQHDMSGDIFKLSSSQNNQFARVQDKHATLFGDLGSFGN